MPWLRAFLAGFLATFVFHQVLLAVLHAAGIVPAAPFNFAPTAPLGVPAVVSLAFWGGVWAILIHALLRGRGKAQFWGGWVVLGAIGPTAVAMLVVFPLKGVAVSLGMVPIGLLLNGFWGLGTAVFLRASTRVPGLARRV